MANRPATNPNPEGIPASASSVRSFATPTGQRYLVFLAIQYGHWMNPVELQERTRMIHEHFRSEETMEVAFYQYERGTKFFPVPFRLRRYGKDPALPWLAVQMTDPTVEITGMDVVDYLRGLFERDGRVRSLLCVREWFPGVCVCVVASHGIPPWPCASSQSIVDTTPSCAAWTSRTRRNSRGGATNVVWRWCSGWTNPTCC